METRIKIIGGFLILFFVGLIISLSIPAQAYSISYCQDVRTIICVDMDESLPQNEALALENIVGVLVVDVDYDERTTHIEYDNTILKLPPGDIGNYLDLLETHIHNQRAMSTIRPDLLPPPLCLLDGSTLVVNGVYSFNNQIIVIQGDERCDFTCSGIGCIGKP